MKKLFYQLLIERLFLISIIAGLANSISAVVYAISLIDLNTARYVTLILCFLNFVIHVLIEFRLIKWVSKDGQRLRVVNFNWKTYWILFILLAFIWVGPAINYWRGDNEPPARKIVIKTFEPKRNSFNILIFSFNSECEYMGKKYDIGKVLQRRLEDIKERENININTQYITDSIDYSNFTTETAKEILKNSNADMFIYGSYSFKQCEGGTSDKVCFNYLTNAKKRWGISNNDGFTAYKMIDIDGLEGIRQGEGQEDMDYLLYTVISMADMNQQHYSLAIERIKKINGYENDEKSLFNMSHCYFFKNDFDSSGACLEKVLAMNPANKEAAVHFGVLLMKDGKMAKAKTWFEEILNTHPDDFGALRNLVLVHKNLKDTVRARIYFERMVATIPPTNDTNLTKLGIIYKDMGDFQKARGYLERSLQIDPRNTTACTNLATIYDQLKLYDIAKLYSLFVTRIDSNLADAWYNAGIQCMNKKNYAEAHIYLTKAVQKNPEHENGWTFLGANYVLENNYEKAASCFEKALEINPRSSYTLYISGLSYRKLKKYEQAKDCLERLVAVEPTHISGWNILGAVYGDMNKNEKAIACFKKMLTMVPENGVIFYNLASVSSYQRNRTNTLRYLSKSLRLMPSLKKLANEDKAYTWLKKEKDFIALTSEANKNYTTAAFTN